ncbi:MAG: hypothetical protein FJZ00_04740, partial [Candidatus Sericytochromatia bacterium]|nr:hypothetical protein [Candidatus Tanganyikabacteria bacterium]
MADEQNPALGFETLEERRAPRLGAAASTLMGTETADAPPEAAESSAGDTGTQALVDEISGMATDPMAMEPGTFDMPGEPGDPGATTAFADVPGGMPVGEVTFDLSTAPPEGEYKPPEGYAPPPEGQYYPPPGDHAPPPPPNYHPPEGEYKPPMGYAPPPEGQYYPPPGDHAPPPPPNYHPPEG